MPRNTEIGATKGSYIYPLRLPEDLREQWAAYCLRNKKKSPSILRALMRYVIQDDMPPEVRRWIFEQIEGQSDSEPKKRFEIRLIPTEYHAVNLRAEAEGCSVQRWVINCIRASLTHQPQFTMETTKALWESSKQLRAIGRNLNQIAKRLNEGELGTLKAEQLEKLAEYIYMHTHKVAALQDASLSRWGLDLQVRDDQ